MVTAQALREFKQIYKEEFGIELSDQVALDKAERFLMLMKAIYQPIPKKNPFIQKRGGDAPTKNKRQKKK